MDSIYIHISPSKLPVDDIFDTMREYTFSCIPEYAKHSFDQCEKFLNKKSIIIDDVYINDVFKLEIKDFLNICKVNFPKRYHNAFWLTTLTRLYVLNLYCQKNSINEFIHLEYDNLIYSNLDILQKLTKSLYFTRVGPYLSSAGFVYCNCLDHLDNFTTKLKQLLSKGENALSKFTTDPNISEMSMIDMIYRHTNNVIDYLPILPNRIGNDNYESLNSVFDGASYGQFIGGTNNGHSRGWFGLHHYTGQSINDRLIYPYFDKHEKKPYVIYENERIPILNLHIHSKQLHKFI